MYLRSTVSKYKFGAHVSIAGGVSKSVVNAFNIGCNSFAMFLKSPRQWKSKPYQKEEIQKFKEYCEKYNYDPATDVLPHGSYFINLANPDPEKAEKAYEAFIDDLYRCEQLGIGLYNFHPGSSLQGDHVAQLKQLAGYINRAIKETNFVKLVLENMAGHGNLIGSNLQDLQTVIEMVENKERVGVCIDTCHTFAAGYDIANQTAFDCFWQQFEAKIGMKYLSSIHLNDSKACLSANTDRHELLGEGYIGLELFRIIANTEFLKNIPIILETPQKDDNGYGEEIKLLEWLETKEDATDQDFIVRRDMLQKNGIKSRQEFANKFKKKKTKMSKSSMKKSTQGTNDILSQIKRTLVTGDTMSENKRKKISKSE